MEEQIKILVDAKKRYFDRPPKYLKGDLKISGICPISRQHEHQFCHQNPNELLSNANLPNAFEL